MSVKQRALQLLRRTRLLGLADTARFRWHARGSGARRSAFARAWGDAPLPPEDIAYDAYGSLDWDFYWGFGRLISGVLAERIRTHARAGRVLEWGCGPARIVRHLPALLGPEWEVHGTDSNVKTIRWCTGHLPDARFAENGALPPLPYPDAHFDFVYSVSVFTHLPEDAHVGWAGELRRVLKPGGLLFCTLNGNASRALLMPSEQADYDAGRIVVRGGVSRGTRCFLAWHPPPFVTAHLLRDFDVLEHEPAPNLLGERQDVWVARRRAG
jgi:SAM-dependent methyltransferase